MSETKGKLIELAAQIAAAYVGNNTVPQAELPRLIGEVYRALDGKKFKSLKRHLRSHYNLSPEQYREKWNLAADYPMVAPNYAEARSNLAKRMGLGQRRRAG
ncbi:MAG: MucR family transcriptional regulator [Rhizobiales bacterium]|nr:MucR family transcriptional regulator [Hyphomicrobiales bacterium]